MACPHLDIRDGPTRTPSGTWVPIEVTRARVGPPMALVPGFVCGLLGHVVPLGIFGPLGRGSFGPPLVHGPRAFLLLAGNVFGGFLKTLLHGARSTVS